jgi:hypothetical protein
MNPHQRRLRTRLPAHIEQLRPQSREFRIRSSHTSRADHCVLNDFLHRVLRLWARPADPRHPRPAHASSPGHCSPTMASRTAVFHHGMQETVGLLDRGPAATPRIAAAYHSRTTAGVSAIIGTSSSGARCSRRFRKHVSGTSDPSEGDHGARSERRCRKLDAQVPGGDHARQWVSRS